MPSEAPPSLPGSRNAHWLPKYGGNYVTGVSEHIHFFVTLFPERYDRYDLEGKKKPAKYREKKRFFFGGIVRIRLQQVSDARRLYESKMEAKPMIVPALKVSDAKRAFETAAKSASAAKPAVGAGQNTLPRRTLIQTLPNVAPTTRPGQRPAAAAGATNSEPVNPAVSPLVPNFISFFLSTLCIECFPESRNVRNIYKA